MNGNIFENIVKNINKNNIDVCDINATDIVLVRYGEIALKSKGVRNLYERILMKNIEAMLNQEGVNFSNLKRESGRIFIHSNDVRAAIVASRVFGVISTSPAITINSNIDDIANASADIGTMHIEKSEPFAIRVKRTGNHNFSSKSVAIKCGDAVWKKLELANKNPSVDLTNPKKEIFIEVRQKYTYIYIKSFKGVGGLPLGTQGKMVMLISGGIDSPVAAWFMMRRGVEIIFVHCNTEPYTLECTKSRTIKCIKALKKWAPGRNFKIYEVPHGNNLIEFINKCNPKNTCILCHRTMYRIGHEIMKKEGATGVVTGSSMGQVASQTSSNLYAEMYGLDIPIYHPLICFDKTEIIHIAEKIGTFEISTDNAAPCTAVPDRPEVNAKHDILLLEEKKIKIDELISESVSNACITILD